MHGGGNSSSADPQEEIHISFKFPSKCWEAFCGGKGEVEVGKKEHWQREKGRDCECLLLGSREPSEGTWDPPFGFQGATGTHVTDNR